MKALFTRYSTALAGKDFGGFNFLAILQVIEELFGVKQAAKGVCYRGQKYARFWAGVIVYKCKDITLRSNSQVPRQLAQIPNVYVPAWLITKDVQDTEEYMFRQQKPAPAKEHVV